MSKKEENPKTSSKKEIPEGLKEITDLFGIKILELTEALSDLQIYVKYLLFEKEALTRERDFFMKQLFNPDENGEEVE